MPKRIAQAHVRVPEAPRVRFYQRVTENGAVRLQDVTTRVAMLVLEDLEENGSCALLRLDSDGKLVWRSRFPSLREAKWHVEFEYGLPEEKWSPC